MDQERTYPRDRLLTQAIFSVVVRIETKVLVKPTNSGLLLHYHSHVYNRYKRGLLTTMLDRAYRLSSSWSYFIEECERLKCVFSKLKYPKHPVDSTAC